MRTRTKGHSHWHVSMAAPQGGRPRTWYGPLQAEPTANKAHPISKLLKTVAGQRLRRVRCITARSHHTHYKISPRCPARASEGEHSCSGATTDERDVKEGLPHLNFVVVVRAQGGIRCSARASVAGISECERRGEGAQKRRSERGRHLARGAPGEGRIHLGGALQIELRCTTARSHHAALRDHERGGTRAQGPHLTRGVYTWEGLCRLNFVASLRDHTTLPCGIIQQRALVLRVHERER